MRPYDPKSIEEKWLTSWEEQQLFQGTANQWSGHRAQGTGETGLGANRQSPVAKNKFYALFAFAYPSGSGLHVGHVESKTALDILVRYLRMTGNDVFFPVGWDAFGLPAENYAIKTGIHPSVTTRNAIDTFRRQIKRLGISYDWETELATCHPEYYKWTQWIFIQLFKAGLAYRDKGWVNWCPQDKTVLANEQVVDGACERCGSRVIQKELEQWKFKITKYQDELLSGLSEVDWPKATKLQQENWIGKSEGAEVRFKVKGKGEKVTQELRCFTTRLDTIYGVTFVVISPEKFKELNLINLVSEDQKSAVSKYLDAAFHKTEEQRRVGEKNKTGVDTRIRLVHPLTKQEIPLWVADYVLAGYGTGVVMGVPAHDARDHAFAKKFELPMIEVVEATGKDKQTDGSLFSGYGTLVNSEDYSGLASEEAIQTLLTNHSAVFERKTSYKLRDWLISRQRYWGAPIPMVLCEDCGWQAVPENQLPVRLPELEDFTPTDDGKSPLEKAPEDWKFVACPNCGKSAKREVDTMDTFVDSSWYFLRYASRNLSDVAFDKTLTNALLPADLYLIGPEHIVLHLLYARFFTKFLRDQGYLSFNEPFAKMRHQGMILGPDGKKMSKSKGNVISPDEIIEKFGADTLRMYEMFMGPLDADKAWDMSSVAGIYRFLNRVCGLFQANLDQLEKVQGSGFRVQDDSKTSQSEPLTFNLTPLQRKLHWAIDKLTRDIPELKFNTAIAALMELVNVWSDTLNQKEGFSKEELSMFVRLLTPFAPFLTEDLWSQIEGETSVHLSQWPKADPALLTQEEIDIVVQVNGKLRTKVLVPATIAGDSKTLEANILANSTVKTLIDGKPLRKVITVPGRLVNIVL